jgi:hypothetical protein
MVVFAAQNNHMTLTKKLALLVLALVVLLPYSAQAIGLYNPLGTTDINVMAGRVISAMIGLSGVVALLMFTWGGFQWIWSGGEQKKVQAGKDTMVWAAFGLVIIFTSYILVTAVVNALTTGDALQVKTKVPTADESASAQECPAGKTFSGYEQGSDGNSTIPICN